MFQYLPERLREIIFQEDKTDIHVEVFFLKGETVGGKCFKGREKLDEAIKFLQKIKGGKG